MDTIFSTLANRGYILVSDTALESACLRPHEGMPCDCDGDCGQGDCDCTSDCGNDD